MMQVEEEGNNQADDFIDCPICYTELHGDETVDLETCSHRFHKDCFFMFLENKVKARNAEMICPLDCCRKELSVNQIVSLLPSQLAEEFYTYTFDQMVEQ